MKTLRIVAISIQLTFALVISIVTIAQIGIGTTTPNASSMLEINSNSKGLLVPRMTAAQISAISFPAKGLLVYQTDGTEGFYYNSGIPPLPIWTPLSTPPAIPSWNLNGTNIHNSNTGNVGIGTDVPQSILSVGNTSQFQVDATGDIKRINNVPYSFPAAQGSNGQILYNNGTGSLSWGDAGTKIYTINSSNYLTNKVPDNNYVKIEGTITLSANYSGIENDYLAIHGGTFIGNSVHYISGGDHNLYNGVTFNNINIGSGRSTFINCTFNGNCPQIGSENTFINCNFDNFTTSSNYQFGFIHSSTIKNSTIPRVIEIINSEIDNSTIGGTITSLINCRIDDCTINAFSNETTISHNKFGNTKINIGNSDGAGNVVVTNNIFDGLLSGTTTIIEIDPSDNFPKVCNIQNNIFEMSNSSPQAIKISQNDGSSSGYSILSIQGNSFFNGLTTLTYSSNLKVVYTQNIALSTNNPSATGNLIVTNNFSY